MLYWLLDFLLIELPEAFVMLLMGLSVFNLSFRDMGMRGVWYTLFSAVAAFLLTYGQVPFEAKIIVAVPIIAAIAWITLRLPLQLAFVFALSTLLVHLIAEIFVLLLLGALSIPLDLVATHQPAMIAALWLRLLLVLAVVYLLRKRQLDLRAHFTDTKPGRYLTALVIAGGMELLLILGAATSSNLLQESADVAPIAMEFPLLLFLILLFFLVLIVLFRLYLAATLDRVEEEVKQPYLQHIEDLVTAIRSIKHDAVNHYTAIEGFLKMGMSHLAVEYVKQLLKESASFIQVKHIKRPHISALLHAKLALAISERIPVSLEIFSATQFSFMKTQDLVTFLGVMLDGAIRSASREAEEKRYIRLHWDRDTHEEFVSLEFSGTPGDTAWEQTTSEIARRYEGNLTVETADDATRLRASFSVRPAHKKKPFQPAMPTDQNSSL